MAISGNCAAGFEPVRDAFAANFNGEGGEVGAAVAVVVDGRTVVDLWGGVADPTTGVPWEHDTHVLVFSTTKGLTSVCALRLWEGGDLDLDVPVAELWPEFAAAGKSQVTTRHLLSHQAGLPAFDQPLAFDACHDQDLVAARLAAQAPRWEPGTAHGYHALTFGWLVGEVVRRTTGRTVGQVLTDDVAGPLGLDLFIGLKPEREASVARLLPPQLDLTGLDPDDPVVAFTAALLDPASLTFQVFSNPPQLDVELFNDPALHRAEWPAANGIVTARSLAVLYGELACDRLLSAATLDQATRPHAAGHDLVLREHTEFGLGFALPIRSDGRPPASFGHDGAGGSVGFADRRAGVGFAYTMNQLSASLGADQRSRRLVEAVYACL